MTIREVSIAAGCLTAGVVVGVGCAVALFVKAMLGEWR